MQAGSRAIVRPDEFNGVMRSLETRADRVFKIFERTATEDRVWFVDGYELKDETTQKSYWKLVLVCPKCDQPLTIDDTKKAIEVTERGIEVEPFGCTWPGTFGQVECTFRAGIVPPPSGDRKFTTSDGVTHVIDGMFKRA